MNEPRYLSEGRARKPGLFETWAMLVFRLGLMAGFVFVVALIVWWLT